MAQPERSGGESTLTVVLALAVNLVIAIMKGVAGALTGSAAMLSEAAHSVADTVTEVFLLTAVRTSARPADRRHPFGYGKERYFWSLLAAVSIFASGALFAFVEGVSTLRSGEAEQKHVLIGYLVLAVSFALEATSWWRALRQVRQEADDAGRAMLPYLRLIDDPAPKTVLYEDSAALIGLLLAFAGLGLHQLTGSSIADGLASLLIGLLLATVAYTLGYTNRGLLIGRQADPRLVRELQRRLGETAEVDAVVDLLTMVLGADRVLLCARLDFDNALGAADLERACVRIAGELTEEFPDLHEIFLEPVPRSDPELRERVLARYGEVMSQRVGPAKEESPKRAR
ncbi:MAG: cation diffusion facilitator family transporter [Sciscionella sp.]